MEIVNSYWKEVPGSIIPQDILNFYQRILDKMKDD